MGSVEGKRVVSGINLPQFSSATVPKVGVLSANCSVQTINIPLALLVRIGGLTIMIAIIL